MRSLLPRRWPATCGSWARPGPWRLRWSLVRQTGTDAPQVVVSDVQLAGDAEGFRLLDQVRQGGPAVILLSAFDQPPLLRTAFERGAAGYLVKTDDVPAILAAVRVVAAGGSAFSGAMLRTIRNAPRRPSERELEVLRLLCTGASNDEIAAAVGLSERTVESHLRRMFDRYGVLSRTELAVLAVREGWSGGAGARAARGPGGGAGWRGRHGMSARGVAALAGLVLLGAAAVVCAASALSLAGDEGFRPAGLAADGVGDPRGAGGPAGRRRPCPPTPPARVDAAARGQRHSRCWP